MRPMHCTGLGVIVDLVNLEVAIQVQLHSFLNCSTIV